MGFWALAIWMCGVSYANPPVKIVITEPTEILGDVHKPMVSTWVSREDLNEPEENPLVESFLPRIIASIDAVPFHVDR